jgi:signal transduction histidine kinase
LGFLRAEASRRGIVVETALTENLPEIRGDKIQLQQVLLNLLMNGMESMIDVVGTRRLSVSTCLHENSAVAIAVTDSGIGIPPHELPRLFQHFFSTKKSGMGLGLSIARSIVEAHGGTIWAENNAGGGATLRLALPIESRAMRQGSARNKNTLLESPV